MNIIKVRDKQRKTVLIPLIDINKSSDSIASDHNHKESYFLETDNWFL